MSQQQKPSGSEIRDSFREFIKKKSETKFNEFLSRFPDPEVFLFDLEEFIEFDPAAGRAYATKPSKYQEYLNYAIQYPRIHSEGFLQGAKSIPVRTGFKKPFHKHRASEAGNLIETEFRITDLDNSGLVLYEGVYFCGACGERNTIDQKIGSEREPYTCDGCERHRVDFELSESQSEYLSFQEGKVKDAQYVVEGYGSVPEYTAEFVGIAADEFQEGDWIRGVGILTMESVDGTANKFKESVRLLYAERLPPEGIGEISESQNSEAFERRVENLDEDYLHGFMDHVDALSDSLPTFKMTEEEAKTKFITPFLEVIGWDPYGPNVRMEYQTDNGAVDYALLGPTGEPVVMVEAKSPSSAVAYSALNQLHDYMVPAGVKWGILTNGLEWKLVEGETAFEPTVIGSPEYDSLDRYTEDLENYHWDRFHRNGGET